MHYRELVLRAVQFQDTEAVPFRHAYGLMPGVLDDWHAQGLPQSVKTETDIYNYFGFPTRSKPLPINALFDPPFKETVIEDTPEYQIAIDAMGRRTKLLKSYTTLPMAETYPVKDHQSWQRYKQRLRFSASRIGDNLERVAQENVTTGHLNGFGVMGFYWLPRDLMGDECLCISYYEQPELVEDILQTWCRLCEQMLTSILQRIRLDFIHFGEDMAYRNGSMISPSLFHRFIKPYYDRIYHLVQKYEVPIFSVDSDGRIDQLIDWFSACGVNLIGPNEVQAGNDIVAYRQRLGKKMSYDGGLNKLELTHGRDAIDAMLHRVLPPIKASGGGWIACLDHRVVRGTTLADFQYYVDRVREMSKF